MLEITTMITMIIIMTIKIANTIPIILSVLRAIYDWNYFNVLVILLSDEVYLRFLDVVEIYSSKNSNK